MTNDTVGTDEINDMIETLYPFVVTYRDMGTNEEFLLLVFALSALWAANIAAGLYEANGVDGVVLSVNLLTVQATVIQKIENKWQDAETTDELDDPIRR